jgi:hypothetical protein
MTNNEHFKGFYQKFLEGYGEQGAEGPTASAFEVTSEQSSKIRAWTEEQDALVVEAQKTKILALIQDPATDEKKKVELEAKLDLLPYYGAIGGSVTYCFTPTSLGIVLKVRHTNGAELNVSDYDEW